MIDLPDFSRPFDYENGFYLSCDVTRMSKVLAQYELFKATLDVPGAIVECGVFKGASLVRFAMCRDLFSQAYSKKIVGFDTFGRFPDTAFAADQQLRDRFVADAGSESIGTEQLMDVLRRKHCDRFVELQAGDIRQTVPAYVAEHPELKISILNLDTDVYEPAVTILEHLYPRIEPGGVLILDDYGVFPGETQAVDEYFSGRRPRIRKFPFCMTPCYVVKE